MGLDESQSSEVEVIHSHIYWYEVLGEKKETMSQSSEVEVIHSHVVAHNRHLELESR